MASKTQTLQDLLMNNTYISITQSSRSGSSYTYVVNNISMYICTPIV